jgi:hypothetical protein
MVVYLRCFGIAPLDCPQHDRKIPNNTLTPGTNIEAKENLMLLGNQAYSSLIQLYLFLTLLVSVLVSDKIARIRKISGTSDLILL